MDDVVQFHRGRIASLLKRQQQQRRAQQAMTTLSDLSLQGRTAINSHLSAPEKFLAIPELILAVLEFLPLENLPQVCLVSNLWRTLAQPLLWRQDILFEKVSQIRAFTNAVVTHGIWVQSLNFSIRNNNDERAVSSPLARIDLTNILTHTPRLRSIDVRECAMDKHPLLFLAPYWQLESIGFTQSEDQFLDLGSNGNKDLFAAWPQLKHLRIWGKEDDYKHVASAALEKALLASNSLHLETIELSNFPFWMASTIHHLVFTNASYLRHLDLAHCNFLPLVLEEILAVAMQLESLGLHYCSTSTDSLLRIAQDHPRLKSLSLSRWIELPTDVMAEVARACPSLVSLALEDCGNIAKAARQFLAHCPQLRSLHIYDLEGPYVMDLFLGAPWVCRGLEEIQIERIDYRPNEFLSAEARDGSIRAMWGQLAAQTHLHSLLLRFCLPQAGAKVLHPNGNYGNAQDKDKIMLDDGRCQLGALKRLKRFGLQGYSVWEYTDVAWMVKSFPRLEQFRYDRNELNIPQWSWLRTHHPDIQLISRS
ncbi:hypothetical protein BGZ97_004982 [Linnemannia gamsii]|jgi:hypothetical protein|uniref:F-box domain-containing protein n=1 Tax=Linnemannia gamsii TaxID=64522 RepID=A0A9P6QVY0_9FUNG|nr:hypothetical protein BGZ97_004982 [Linnemannia gamsii]